jgi:hypothetical protein
MNFANENDCGLAFPCEGSRETEVCPREWKSGIWIYFVATGVRHHGNLIHAARMGVRFAVRGRNSLKPALHWEIHDVVPSCCVRHR